MRRLLALLLLLGLAACEAREGVPRGHYLGGAAGGNVQRAP